MALYKESKMLREDKRPVLLQKYIEKGIKGAVDDFILDWDYRDFYISDPCPTIHMGNDATEDFIFDIGFDKIKFEVEALEPLDVSSSGMMSKDNQIKLTLNIYQREGEYEKTFTTHAFGVYDTTLEWFIDCLFGDGIWVDKNETNIEKTFITEYDWRDSFAQLIQEWAKSVNILSYGENGEAVETSGEFESSNIFGDAEGIWIAGYGKVNPDDKTKPFYGNVSVGLIGSSSEATFDGDFKEENYACGSAFEGKLEKALLQMLKKEFGIVVEGNINNLNENKIKRNAMRRQARLSENKLPSYSKFTKRRMVKESEDYIIPNQKDLIKEANYIAENFLYVMEDMLISSSYDYENGDEMNFTLGYATSAKDYEIDDFFEEYGVYDISVKTHPSDKNGKTFFHDTTIESSELTENFSSGLTFDELKRKIASSVIKHLEKKLGAYFPESRSKTIRSKRRMVKESKERPTKKDIEEAIYNLAVSLASDLASGSFDKDENMLYKGATVWAKDEVENEYILDWLEYNGYDSINANVSGTYEYKNEYFEIQIGDRDYYPCDYFMDGEEDYQGFIESIEEHLTREFTDYNDIFELLNDDYYDDFYGESRSRKKSKRMIGESSEDKDPKSEKKEDILEAIESFSMLTCAFPIDDLSKQREIEKDENGNKVAVANTIAFTFLIENEKVQEHFRKKGNEEFRILFRSKIEQNGRTSLAEEIFVNDKLIARSAQGYFGAKKAIYDYFVKILEKDKFFDSLKESKRKSFRGGGATLRRL